MLVRKDRPRPSTTLRFLLGVLLVTILGACIFLLITLHNSQKDFETADRYVPPPTERFPVSVIPADKVIVENPNVDYFFESVLADTTIPDRRNWWGRLHATVAQLEWFQNLASPVARTLVIWPGERKEQVVDHIGDILKWDYAERSTFLDLIEDTSPSMPDGKFFPGTYVVNKDADPELVATLLIERFNSEIMVRYDEAVQSQVPLQDALTIASLLEREAYDFTDMRIIAGIIWNRLFIDMNLQLDASLQYAKANQPYEPAWWPVVRPADKYIDSPFNTYLNSGLPPSPIANPSPAAILAALNPRQTSCLFYFHDADGQFFCSVDYADHVKSLTEQYGQGR